MSSGTVRSADLSGPDGLVPSAAGRICIVGCGLKPWEHLTGEAQERIRSAGCVYHSRYNEKIVEHVRALNPRAQLVEQEDDEYMIGMFRPAMYDRMAERVVASARAGASVTVLQPGSAMVVDSVTQFILSRAAQHGLSVEVLPGVSSVDGVLATMEYDLSEGLQVILAQRLVLHRRTLDASMAAVIIQPGYYDTLWYLGAARSGPGRFGALREALLRTWPAAAPAALVLLPFQHGDRPDVLWFHLGDIELLHDRITALHTLFIPPTTAATIDESFHRRITSLDAVLAQVSRDQDGRVLESTFDEWFDSTAASDVLRDRARALAELWRTRVRAPFPVGPAEKP